VPLKAEVAEPSGTTEPPKAGTDSPAPDPAKTDPGKVEVAKTDPPKTEPGKPEPGTPRADPVKPDPAKAPEPWSVTISANEPGVEITLDGRVRGVTPDVRVSDLAPGKSYRGIARKQGFISETFTVENKNGERTVSLAITLMPEPTKEPVRDPPPRKDPPPVAVKKDPTPAPPRDPPPPREPPPPKASAAKGRLLKVASTPTGADVLLDGKPTGRKTPILPGQPLEVPAGKHKIQFKFGGKLSAPIDIVVTEGDNAAVIRGDIPQ
jgi:hypothetical protein